MRARERTGIALLSLCLGFGGVAAAQDDPLSRSDYRWLHENLNVLPNSMTLRSLTQSQKRHVNGLINGAKLSPEKRVMESGDYLYGITGEDFERTLRQSEELIVAPLPDRD